MKKSSRRDLERRGGRLAIRLPCRVPAATVADVARSDATYRTALSGRRRHDERWRTERRSAIGYLSTTTSRSRTVGAIVEAPEPRWSRMSCFVNSVSASWGGRR